MFNKQSHTLLSLLTVILVSSLLAIPTCLSAASINLAKTGQVACYNQSGLVIDCAGTGQDGEHQMGVEWPDLRFTDNGDGTITDNLSGLTWLQDTQCVGRVKWLDALDTVNGLANGSCGLTDSSVAGDWRMPNYLELISLANLGTTTSIAWFTSFGFTNLEGYGYWSSTSYTQTPSSALGYQFNQLFSGVFPKSATYQTWPVKGISAGPAKVWKTGQSICYGSTDAIPCTGTGQDGEYQAGEPHPAIRFTDNTDGTVTDNLTGLIWLKDVNCFGPGVWLDAFADANNMADGDCGLTDGSSAGDWRIPNPLEIVSLSDFSQTLPAFPPGHPFTNVPYLYHWASASWTALPSYSYAGFTTAIGFYSNANKSDTEIFVTWPVRGGDVVLPDPIFADGFE